MSTTEHETEPDDEQRHETEETTETVSRETEHETEPDDDETEPDDEHDGDTFPRAYVEQLRGKQRRYRERAKAAEERAGTLSAELWRSRVEALDRLADPADLPLPEDIDPLDPDAVAAAVDELLERKPHLAARRARGNLGQHERRETDEPVSLAGMLRANA